MVASVTQTLGVPFGSGFAVPGTGVVLNNILKWMDRDSASPNVVRPGRKAGTMMSPTQVFRDDTFVLSIGTPGSYGILQTTAQMLLNVLEFGMNVQEAIEAPRVRVYRDRLVDVTWRRGVDQVNCGGQLLQSEASFCIDSRCFGRRCAAHCSRDDGSVGKHPTVIGDNAALYGSSWNGILSNDGSKHLRTYGPAHRAAGAQAYVSKPISVARFVQEVDALLARKQPVTAEA